MYCDMCKKAKASVHLTEIIDGQAEELHLCEECARTKSAEMEQHFGLADLLAGLADFSKNLPEQKEAEFKCPNCGLSYADFKKVGRLGCSQCYSVFRKNLEPLLKRIHGSSHHTGKSPSRIRTTKSSAAPKAKTAVSELSVLKMKLQKAIEEENFEEAVILRDKIKAAEQQNKDLKGK